MASSILSIGMTGLQAAQAGLNTTGHNIANVGTPGFSRQQVIQSTAGGQNEGVGYIGKGTSVADVTRVYSEFLSRQVTNIQTTKGWIDTYFGQINQINNQFADAASGLSPALQDFFKGVQDMAANPNSASSRQSALSTAESLTSRMHNLNDQLNELRAGVNSQLTSTIEAINTAAQQISTLNNAIEVAQGTSGMHLANDLLDQRDQVVSDLSKLVAVSVVKQGNSNSLSIFVGTGQPLVVGTVVFNLVATTSPTDLSRTEVGVSSNGVVAALPETALSGGMIGGLFDFRRNTLDVAQNSLGRVAVGLAMTFNDQHRLGQDQNGALGLDFFNAAPPVIKPNATNTGTALPTARISDASSLTISDYEFRVIAGTVPGPASYSVRRLSDNVTTAFTTFPQTIDGIDFNMGAGTQNAGDDFLIQPTINGAAEFSTLITDTRKIAAATPIRTAAPAANTGSGKIGPAVVDSVSLTPNRTLTWAAGILSGFPPLEPVTVTSGGVSTVYPVGTPVPWAGLPGDTVSFDGVELSNIPAVAGAYLVGPPNATLTFDTAPLVTGNILNTGNLVASASVSNPVLLTTSDYRIDYAAGGYSITRLSDNVVVYPTNAVFPPAAPIDGLNFAVVSGAPAVGDSFLVQRNTLTGFPPYMDVTVTPAPGGGAPVTYLPGFPVTFVPGSTISYGGVHFTVAGSPSDADTFTVGSNPNGVGDNRNALLLAALQITNTLAGKSTSYQGAYSQLINTIGNKTRELQVNGASEEALLTQARQSQQSLSGVNLDEEATNLIRYQQAYQASGKIMQTASILFDTILSLKS
ncbi:hypothetical protein BH11PSE11_BH11PSE11_16910 [soil metagenome]